MIAALSAALACAFFTIIGLTPARMVAPPGVPPLGLAPALGWAMFSVLALPILSLIGFSFASVVVLGLLALVAAVALSSQPAGAAILPGWAVALAGCAALIPLIAILPKPVADGMLLGPPMFDHVKIAVVDAILRSGLPVQNPYLAASGTAPSLLNYYYLWHFSTALLAEALRLDGWTADAAMTGFTAFSSLLLMMAIAKAGCARAVGIAAVPLLSLPGSLRPLLDAAAGDRESGQLLLRNGDLAGWLDQSAWVPQHLASACCVVLAVLLMPGLAGRRRIVCAAVLGLVVAAGLQSSSWIGGVAFAAVAPATGLALLAVLPRDRWRGVTLLAGAAAILACALSAGFITGQIASVAARRGGAAIGLLPYATLGDAVPAGWRVALDLPAFWLLLPFGLPAVVPLGGAAILAGWRQRHRLADETRIVFLLLGVCAGACLFVAWLFRSTIDNNDLGWRAVLPPILVLTGLGASLAGRLVRSRGWVGLAAVCGSAALGLPNAYTLLHGFIGGQHPGDAAAFARSAVAWPALRRFAGPDDRIADNPMFAERATPWPVNIAWALLSDRPSCYAGRETVLAYGPIPRGEIEDREARFRRVFEGRAQPGDVGTLARTYGCQAILILPGDGAWANDPFAADRAYRLAEATQAWRIYVRRAGL